ncbi:uncharacterized protein Tco025E_09304, partial [Trypanosoma conorhini]
MLQKNVCAAFFWSVKALSPTSPARGENTQDPPEARPCTDGSQRAPALVLDFYLWAFISCQYRFISSFAGAAATENGVVPFSLRMPSRQFENEREKRSLG